MAGGIISTVKNLANTVAIDKGLELVDVEFVKEGSTKFLRIYIYKKAGVGIDDCVAVHRELEKLIDDTIEIPGPYTMEVSSPGYNRALKTQEDFARYMEEEVEVRLYKPVDGSKKFTGILKSFENDIISIESENGLIKFNKEETAKVNRIFKI